jgi:hypothetical protein
MTFGGATDGPERDRLSWRLGVPSGAGAKLKEAKSGRNYPKRRRKSGNQEPAPEVRLTHLLKNTSLRFAQLVIESGWSSFNGSGKPLPAKGSRPWLSGYSNRFDPKLSLRSAWGHQFQPSSRSPCYLVPLSHRPHLDTASGHSFAIRQSCHALSTPIWHLLAALQTFEHNPTVQDQV